MEPGDEYQGRYRRLTGPLRVWERGMLVMVPVLGAIYGLDIPTRLGILVWREQYLGLFIALVLGAVFLGVVPSRKSSFEVVPWFDIVLALLGLLVGLYLTAFYPRYSLGLRTSLEPVMGGLAILLALEATRRLLGWGLGILAAAFLPQAGCAHL